MSPTAAFSFMSSTTDAPSEPSVAGSQPSFNVDVKPAGVRKKKKKFRVGFARDDTEDSERPEDDDGGSKVSEPTETAPQTKPEPVTAPSIPAAVSSQQEDTNTPSSSLFGGLRVREPITPVGEKVVTDEVPPQNAIASAVDTPNEVPPPLPQQAPAEEAEDEASNNEDENLEPVAPPPIPSRLAEANGEGDEGIGESVSVHAGHAASVEGPTLDTILDPFAAASKGYRFVVSTLKTCIVWLTASVGGSLKMPQKTSNGFRSNCQSIFFMLSPSASL